MKIIFAFLALLLTLGGHAQDANRRTQDANGRTRDANFIAPPYLQIGRTPSPGSLDLLWQTKDAPGEWKVEWKSATGGKWQTLPPATVTRVAPAGLAPRLLYKTSFTGLTPGALFDYRVRRDGRIIFTAAAHALKAADQSFRLIVSGDIGAATPDAKLLAQQAWLAKPDLFVIPGDIIYENGRVSEYDTNFWPVYNADSSTPSGAPLMRSIAFVGAPGNHDLDNRSLDQFPDGLAYFYFWDQPLNGPEGREGNAFVPPLKASDSNRAAFIRAAGDAYPRMANYSFDYGNTHWTVIDSDPYVDWTDKGLCDWVAKDLAAATQATWRFVVFHHPGFNSSREHYEQQQMRLLSPIFEKGSVDIVFCGHVHNYQRSYPLTFLPDRKGTLLVGGRDNTTIRGRVVPGRWTLDKSFDGNGNTRPKGIVYIVTGAGGQELYNPEQTADPDSWQKFTDKFLSTQHSISVLDIDGRTFSLRQMAADGQQIDSFRITK